MRDAVYPHTSEQVNDRISFEQELLNSQAPANSQAWLKYIAFEQKKQQPQRAKMLFEVALAVLLVVVLGVKEATAACAGPACPPFCCQRCRERR